MRIVAGKHRSRRLLSPENEAIRPTSDKVRQAIFNMLQHRGAVIDSVVLDAFCGTGALALEALSQGAARAIFFDRDKSSLDLARRNAALLKEGDLCSFYLYDATQLPAKPDTLPPAGLCFLDPPYRKDLLLPALQALRIGGWLEKEAWIVAEMEREYDFAALETESEKIYGETKIQLGRCRV